MFRTAKQNRIFQDVVEQIQEAVFSGRIKPGEQLPAERELKDYVYLRQAEVYLKNLQPAKAREYLRLAPSRGGTFLKLYAASLLPLPVLGLLRRLYAFKRKAAPSSDAAMARAEAWVKELES